MEFKELLTEKIKTIELKDIEDADELESKLDDYGIKWEEGDYGHGSLIVYPSNSKEEKEAKFLIKRHNS